MNTSKSQPAASGADAYRRLIDLGIALSAERNHARLMELILLEAKAFTNADGGTLYLKSGDEELSFQIVRNDTLNIAMGGTTGKEINFPPVKLFNDAGSPNMNNVASCAAITGEVIDIADAYTSNEFDFSGTKRFDESTGYRSQSFLTVPLKNHDGFVIGVMQLINAKDPKTHETIPFDREVLPLIDALASQAAVSIDNQMLLEAQKQLLDAFIELMAGAIDAKSPYTGGHCQRVPELTKMLTRAACDDKDGLYKDFDLTEAEWYELHIAGWLHDCGKVTTPEFVVDKATKLETIFDRIGLIDTRFEVLRRDAEIAALKERLAIARQAGRDPRMDELTRREAEYEIDRRLRERVRQIDHDREFLRRSNVGGEFMTREAQAEVQRIGTENKWVDVSGAMADFLTEDEITNLTIARAFPWKDYRTFVDVGGIEQPAPAPRFSRTPAEIAHHARPAGSDTDTAYAAQTEFLRQLLFAVDEKTRLKLAGIR